MEDMFDATISQEPKDVCKVVKDEATTDPTDILSHLRSEKQNDDSLGTSQKDILQEEVSKGIENDSTSFSKLERTVIGTGRKIDDATRLALSHSLARNGLSRTTTTNKLNNRENKMRTTQSEDSSVKTRLGSNFDPFSERKSKPLNSATTSSVKEDTLLQRKSQTLKISSKTANKASEGVEKARQKFLLLKKQKEIQHKTQVSKGLSSTESLGSRKNYDYWKKALKEPKLKTRTSSLTNLSASLRQSSPSTAKTVTGKLYGNNNREDSTTSSRSQDDLRIDESGTVHMSISLHTSSTTPDSEFKIKSIRDESKAEVKRDFEMSPEETVMSSSTPMHNFASFPEEDKYFNNANGCNTHNFEDQQNHNYSGSVVEEVQSNTIHEDNDNNVDGFEDDFVSSSSASIGTNVANRNIKTSDSTHFSLESDNNQRGKEYGRQCERHQMISSIEHVRISFDRTCALEQESNCKPVFKDTRSMQGEEQQSPLTREREGIGGKYYQQQSRYHEKVYDNASKQQNVRWFCCFRNK